jgi:hypothetical protein
VAKTPAVAVTDSQLLTAALALTKPGEDAHKLRVTRYDHSYNVWRGDQKRPPAADPWQSKLRIKFAMQKIDTALVNIVSGAPRIIVKPTHPDDELHAKAMQAVMDHFVAEDHLVEEQPVFVQQGLIYGVTVAKNHWLYREGTRRVQGVPQRVVYRDGPTFEPWNIYDCWWDPNGRDVDSCAYIVLRSWVTKHDLQSNAYNPDTGVGIYQNLDALFATGPGAMGQQTAQEQYNSSGTNKRKGMFELLEIWRDDQLLVIGNRQVIIRNEPNPFDHGKKPIVIAQTRPDLFEMSGIAETELIDHIQEALNTVKNMRMDNFHLTVMRGITYREGGVTDPNALQLRPRFRWAVADHEDIKAFETQPLPPEAYREEDTLKADADQITGINAFVTGGQQQGADQSTATGVTALQDVASRLLRFKASQIHYKGYQRSFEMWGDMAQQFMTEPLWTKIVHPATKEEGWVQVSPSDIAGAFRYKLEGSEESLSRQTERSEAIQLLNSLAPFVQMGVVQAGPLIEKVAMAFNFPNPESLIKPSGAPPNAAPMPQQQGPPPQGGQSPFMQSMQSKGFQQPNGQGQLVGGQELSPVIAQAIHG